MVISADVQAAARSVMQDVSSIEVEPLDGGSSAFVARLVLTSPNGNHRHVVFRQHTDRAVKEHTGVIAAKEFHVTSELAARGLPVARPITLHGEQTSDGPWLVTEWIEGSTAVTADNVDAALSQMAAFLGRLHTVDCAGLLAPGLVKIEDPLEALPRYLTDNEIGRRIREALDLGVSLRPNSEVLLHGDFWPGNVMFDRSHVLVAVLDWEDAKVGDPLVDLACARVELACAYGFQASERFTDQYVSQARARGGSLLLHDLPVWDIYVSATALSAMHLWGLSPADEAARRDVTERFLASAATRLAGGDRAGERS